MIFGDPYKFAIVIDVVDKWSSNGFVSGFFYISIDGILFPNGVVNTTLNSDIYSFFKDSTSSLLTKPENSELFYKDKLNAYKDLYRITFPEQGDDEDEYIENDYLYSCGLNEMENHSCYIFSVRDGNNIRILGCEINNGDLLNNNAELNKKIQDISISTSELDHIVFELKKYYDNVIVAKTGDDI